MMKRRVWLTPRVGRTGGRGVAIAPTGPIITGAGSLSGTGYRIGTQRTTTAGTTTARGGGTVTNEFRTLVNGSPSSTINTFTPSEAQNELPAVSQWRAVETGGTAPGETPWQTVGSGTITYNAPVWGSLTNQSYAQGTGTQSYVVGGLVTVTGDADLSGSTFSLVSPPAGVTLAGSGTSTRVDTSTAALIAGQTVTVRLTNSGGASDGTFTVTVANAVTATLTSVSFNDATEEWSITTDTLNLGSFRLATSLTTEDPTFTPGVGWSANALENFSTPVGPTGPATVNVGTLTSATGNTGDTRRVTIVQDTGVVSNYLRQNFTVDRTAPAITGASVTPGNGQLTYNRSINETGTSWRVVTTSATQPSEAQIKAGQNHLGSAAVVAQTGAITATGAQTALVIGSLTNGTQYWLYEIVEDAHRNLSSTASASGTPSAPSGVVPTYLGSSGLALGFQPRNHTAPVTLAAGQQYVLGTLYGVNGTANYTVSVNGTAATLIGLSAQDDGIRVALWRVTPASSGTSVVLSWDNQPLISIVQYWEVPNAATVATFAASTATSGTTRDGSVNVQNGDGIIAIGGGDGTEGLTWTGLTAAATTNQDGSRAYAASAGNVSAATPRTITATFTDTNNNNGKGLVVAVVRV